MKVKVWFEHQDGPYSKVVEFDSVEAAEQHYQESPQFICATNDLDYSPPVALERGGIGNLKEVY